MYYCSPFWEELTPWRIYIPCFRCIMKVFVVAEFRGVTKMFNELKFSGEGNVRDHLLSMIEINQKLRDLDIWVKDEQVVHVGLQSLPIAYSNLRSMYNAQDKKWDLNKLIFVCCEEQERI